MEKGLTAVDFDKSTFAVIPSRNQLNPTSREFVPLSMIAKQESTTFNSNNMQTPNRREYALSGNDRERVYPSDDGEPEMATRDQPRESGVDHPDMNLADILLDDCDDPYPFSSDLNLRAAQLREYKKLDKSHLYPQQITYLQTWEHRVNILAGMIHTGRPITEFLRGPGYMCRDDDCPKFRIQNYGGYVSVIPPEWNTSKYGGSPDEPDFLYYRGRYKQWTKERGFIMYPAPVYCSRKYITNPKNSYHCQDKFHQTHAIFTFVHSLPVEIFPHVPLPVNLCPHVERNGLWAFCHRGSNKGSIGRVFSNNGVLELSNENRTLLEIDRNCCACFFLDEREPAELFEESPVIVIGGRALVNGVPGYIQRHNFDQLEEDPSRLIAGVYAEPRSKLFVMSEGDPAADFKTDSIKASTPERSPCGPSREVLQALKTHQDLPVFSNTSFPSFNSMVSRRDSDGRIHTFTFILPKIQEAQVSYTSSSKDRKSVV